ncbi:TonB-dependent receptor plug domain-containing protein [Rhodoferax sp.]|jgi:iron complex outermembrane receptor protein|uniref:TonB-dependent receptor plug domain-containing protein n=1 Tax=Rhodoferax sp. TaxID=50421 RepID=UPI0037846503
MKSKDCLAIALWMGIFGLQHAQAQVGAPLSELDFLADIPIVLSVSRLSQRIDETPGAVTILDREMIRLSGARDLADLLRLVPGFDSSMSFERIAPQASYHGMYGSVSNRMQVLVDGRSVYSPFLVGGVGTGLQSVSLSDIERVEVLRGSNSVTYGARAFLGVINIVTLNPSQTPGWTAAIVRGDNLIEDARASFGSLGESGAYRLSLDRRRDGGLQGGNDHNTVERVNFQSVTQIGVAERLELRLGQLAIRAGTGVANTLDNPLRDTDYVANHLQVDWKRTLGSDADLVLRYVRTEERYGDRFAYSLLPLGLPDTTWIDFTGTAVIDTLSVHHTARFLQTSRIAWGAELRSEHVRSRPLYNTDQPVTAEFFRLFGNVESHLRPALILNAGVMAEKSADGGDTLAPRLMLNWHVAPGHTWRIGESHAYRPASAFEQRCDVRYATSTGVEIAITNKCSGDLRPEFVRAREIGYLGEFPQAKLAMDVRVFNEQLSGMIFQGSSASGVKSYSNADQFALDGLEYQVKWRPWAGSQLLWSQTYLHNDSSNVDTSMSVAAQSSSLAWFQKLPGNMEFSLMHNASGPRVLAENRAVDMARSVSRTDVRFAVPLRLGSKRGEWAITVQNIGSPYADYDPKRVSFQQRAFVSVSAEM